MVSATIIITNEKGLHLRPAGTLIKETRQHSSRVTLVYEEKKINGKSLINVISACIPKDAEVIVECEGADEVEVLAKIQALAAQNFEI